MFFGTSAEKTNSGQSLEERNVLPCSAVVLSVRLKIIPHFLYKKCFLKKRNQKNPYLFLHARVPVPLISIDCNSICSLLQQGTVS